MEAWLQLLWNYFLIRIKLSKYFIDLFKNIAYRQGLNCTDGGFVAEAIIKETLDEAALEILAEIVKPSGLAVHLDVSVRADGELVLRCRDIESTLASFLPLVKDAFFVPLLTSYGPATVSGFVFFSRIVLSSQYCFRLFFDRSAVPETENPFMEALAKTVRSKSDSSSDSLEITEQDTERASESYPDALHVLKKFGLCDDQALSILTASLVSSKKCKGHSKGRNEILSSFGVFVGQSILDFVGKEFQSNGDDVLELIQECSDGFEGSIVISLRNLVTPDVFEKFTSEFLCFAKDIHEAVVKTGPNPPRCSPLTENDVCENASEVRPMQHSNATKLEESFSCLDVSQGRE